MKLLFAMPTYGSVFDPMLDKNHRVAIMCAANRGVSWVGDISPDRMGWAAARNQIVKSAVEAAKDTEIDGVFWVDDDVMIPPDTIHRLSGYGLDFVSGLYFQRAAPYWPLFARLNKRMSFEFAADYPENVLAPCDGVGFGCVYTSISLLRRVSEMHECKEFGPFGGDFGKRSYGEDFTFCLHARRLGLTPHVDTGVKCEHHMGPEFADEVLFKRLGGLSAAKGA